jgi:Ca2+/H+ antiporter, TMEM165/GDT1 family
MSLLESIWAYVLVFILAAAPFFEAYAVIPLAILAGLPTVPVIIIGLAGNILTILLLLLFIQKIKEWRRKKGKNDEHEEPSKRSIRAKKLWEKYGLPGLAFIGPLFVGSHLTAFMSVTLGGTKKGTLYWMIASITSWSIIFSIFAYFGVDLLGRNEDSFLKEIFNNQ